MGIVYYGRYFEYFEAGRNEFLRQLNYPYSKIESSGLILPVIEAHSNYYAPARYDGEIILETFLKNIPSVRIRLEYIIYDSKENKLADGYTVHSFVNYETKKPSRPPSDFINILKPYFK